MYHVTDDLARVRRYGRWQSDAFHGYLWESHEPMKQIANRMAQDRSSLTKPANRRVISDAGTSDARRVGGPGVAGHDEAERVNHEGTCPSEWVSADLLSSKEQGRCQRLGDALEQLTLDAILAGSSHRSQATAPGLPGGPCAQEGSVRVGPGPPGSAAGQAPAAARSRAEERSI